MRTNHALLIRRYGICLAVWVASWVALPFLALSGVPWPPKVRSVLFFWPQFVLLPNGIVDRTTRATTLGGAALYFTAVFWLVAIALYVLVTRHVRPRWVAAGFGPLLGALTGAISVALWLLGAAPLLDGP